MPESKRTILYRLFNGLCGALPAAILIADFYSYSLRNPEIKLGHIVIVIIELAMCWLISFVISFRFLSSHGKENLHDFVINEMTSFFGVLISSFVSLVMSIFALSVIYQFAVFLNSNEVFADGNILGGFFVMGFLGLVCFGHSIFVSAFWYIANKMHYVAAVLIYH